MNPYKEESIILGIGDLKLSDTYYTFGQKRNVNGYQYIPLENPGTTWISQISIQIAHGDSREGVSISNEKARIFLIFGSNRSGSNAQNMAIGYYNGIDYFFIDECFEDIYAEKPILGSRRIIKCQSLWESNENDIVKEVFDYYSFKNKEKLTIKEKNSLEELIAKINEIEQGLTKTSLSNLRIKELALKKKIAAQQRDDEER